MSSLLQHHNHQPIEAHDVMSEEEERWESMFKQQIQWKVENGIFFSAILLATAEYINAQGHGWVPKDTPESPKLGLWARDIRILKRTGKLCPSKQLALDSIGFVWEEKVNHEAMAHGLHLTFEDMLQVVKEYIKVQGNGWVPYLTPEFRRLGRWAETQRSHKRQGTLSTLRRLALENIGFVWEEQPQKQDSTLEEILKAMAEYIRVQGHGWVPKDTPNDPNIGSWAHYMRDQKGNGKLCTSIQLALDRIGFVWEEPQKQDSTWEEILKAMAEYIRGQGHGWVPKDTPDDPNIGSWAHYMRDQKANGKLSTSIQLALDRIGFVWEEPAALLTCSSSSFDEDTIFAEMLQATAEFIQVQGHGWVPFRTPEDPDLGQWAQTMRMQKRAGDLSVPRRSALEGIGFQWEEPLFLTSSLDDPVTFSEMLQEAAKYITIQGHGWVPNQTPEFPKLGCWAQLMRKRKREGKLPTSRQLALENIEFVWEKRDIVKFEDLLRATAVYIRVRGHGWIPQQTTEFPKLGNWADLMRRLKREGSLPSARQLALESIGFVWEKQPTRTINDARLEAISQQLNCTRVQAV